MEGPKKVMYDKSGAKLVQALEKRNMEGYYCPTAEEAVAKVLELIPLDHTVSWGGVMTVDQLGIKQKLAQRGQPLIDRDTAKTPEERDDMLHQALLCGTFLMSSNAISIDGQLVNIDGMANRVAALCFGPKHSAATRLAKPSIFTSWPSMEMALLLIKNVPQDSA